MLPYWFYQGPDEFAALDVVSDSASYYLGRRVHSGGSIRATHKRRVIPVNRCSNV